MHTEDEARKKECCGPQAANPQHNGMCSASNCMAWMWGENGHWQGDTSKITPEAGGATWVRNGYCGIAGKDGA